MESGDLRWIVDNERQDTAVGSIPEQRLLRGLERFREVILDLQGVRDVGQGFADEIFRVWATAHPDTRLSAENTLPGVGFMVDRARKQRV